MPLEDFMSCSVFLTEKSRRAEERNEQDRLNRTGTNTTRYVVKPEAPKDQ